MVRRAAILILFVFGLWTEAYAQMSDAEKHKTIYELTIAIRDDNPSRIADFDFDELMRDADENILLSLTQAVCTISYDRVTTYDIKKYYIPYFARLTAALCQTNAVLREMSMGRTSFIDFYLEQVQKATGVAELKTWLGDFWVMAYTAYSYASFALPMSMTTEFSDMGLSTFRYNDLYYLECILYGEPVYIGESIRRGMPDEVIRKLSGVFGLEPDSPDIMKQISQNLWTSCNADNQQFLVDNAYEIMVFTTWAWATVQVTNVGSLVGNALRAAGRDDYYDLAYRVGHVRYGDAFDMVYYASVMSTDGNIDAFNDFANLRENLKAEGCKFAEYNLTECPPEYFNDPRFDDYYEQYARLQWHLVREMAMNDITAYSASSVIAELLTFFGCENLPQLFDHILRVALDMYGRGHTWAMDTIERTLPMISNCGINYPNTMCDVARYYLDLNNIAKVEYILNAFGIIEFAEARTYEGDMMMFDLEVAASTAVMLAYLCKDSGNEEYGAVADRLMQRVVENTRKLDYKDGFTYYMYGYYITDYYCEIEDFDTCSRLLSEALGRCKDRETRLQLMSGLFRVEYSLGNYAAAAKYIKKIVSSIPDYNMNDEWCAGIIKCSVYTGDRKSLNKYAGRYIDALHKQITGTVFNLGGDEREAIWNQLRRNISHITDCLFVDNSAETSAVLTGILYEWSLISKGLLLEADNVMDRKLSSHPNETVRSRYLQMKSLAAQVENDILRNSPEQQGFHQVLLERAQQDVISVMRENNIEYEMSGHLNIHWQDVRDRLQQNEAAVEFGYVNVFEEGDETPVPLYYALVLRRGYDNPVLVGLSTEKEIKTACGSLRDAKLYVTGKPMKELYNMLWQPLEEYLNDGDTVYFSTDGQLHLINMEVLRDEQGLFADERYNLRRLSSTRELCIDRDRTISKARLYGGLNYRMDTAELQEATAQYADADIYRGTLAMRGSVSAGEVPRESLPGTLPEVEDISAMLERHGVEAEIMKGNEGTEESVKALSGSDINLLHFATHGFYMEGIVNYQSGDDLLPPMMRAGLMCSGSEHPLGNTEDGILLAREIADLDFSSVNMCFLSACESARGDVTADGVFGIQRGFKQAGVGTLVMSLWKVNDELAQLMTTAFYRGLVVDKLERHEAFKRARAEARAKYPTRDWAAFIMLD